MGKRPVELSLTLTAAPRLTPRTSFQPARIRLAARDDQGHAVYVTADRPALLRQIASLTPGDTVTIGGFVSEPNAAGARGVQALWLHAAAAAQSTLGPLFAA